jgi:hypothetical protein
VFLTVIVNMVVKPVGQAGWFWGMLVVVLLGIAAVVAFYARGVQQAPVTATE